MTEAAPPYLHSSLPISERVAELLSRMSLEEKAAQEWAFSRQCHGPIGPDPDKMSQLSPTEGPHLHGRGLPPASGTSRERINCHIQRCGATTDPVGIPALVNNEAHGRPAGVAQRSVSMFARTTALIGNSAAIYSHAHRAGLLGWPAVGSGGLASITVLSPVLD